MRRMVLLVGLIAIAAGPARADAAGATKPSMDPGVLAQALARAAGMTRLRALIVAHHGKTVAARAFRGPGLDVPVNVKSVSKSVISALVGVAIARGLLKGQDQPIAPILADRLPRRPDKRLNALTLGHLLSMRSGLGRTSGRNYGRWVRSPHWVRHVLSRPFVDDPGGWMLYSTGNFHVLSAALTKVSGRSTHRLARDWLGAPLGIEVPRWQRDPQGIYLGGNNMKLSPRALLRFGEMYRRGGVHNGKRVIPESWVKLSWTPRARSPYSGDLYGYGWFITEFCGRRVYYARGFGGQFVYVAPSLALTVVITSDTTQRTRTNGYWDHLRALVGGDLVSAALQADRQSCAP